MTNVLDLQLERNGRNSREQPTESIPRRVHKFRMVGELYLCLSGDCNIEHFNTKLAKPLEFSG